MAPSQVWNWRSNRLAGRWTAGGASEGREGAAGKSRSPALWLLACMVAANILAPRCVDAQVEVAFAEWECLVDGSKGPADVEAHSCAWHKDVNRPCQSCLMSEQAAVESSGLSIPIDYYTCYSDTFTIGLGEELTPILCPGTYWVNGCETTEAAFQQRVTNIKKIITDNKLEPTDCFSPDGVRVTNRDACITGFPKATSMERAAHVLAAGRLVAGRNPATYETRVITSCTELNSYLAEHLVGCVWKTALGVVSPMSQEYWCQKVDYRPRNDDYHLRRARINTAGGERRSNTDEPLEVVSRTEPHKNAAKHPTVTNVKSRRR
mmetsp:Transcript_34753/g.82365  ORF Transcript_34753/g.82365 Transcript_34753/m.82365 type:complete len:321 (+) Transcript_34753:88-1050(+)